MPRRISPSATIHAGQPKASELQFPHTDPFVLTTFYIFGTIIVVKLETADGRIQSDGKKIAGDLFYFDKKQSSKN